jgi:hypothetical protein
MNLHYFSFLDVIPKLINKKGQVILVLLTGENFFKFIYESLTILAIDGTPLSSIINII